MKIHRLALSLLVPLAFAVAPASEAQAAGACVFVKHDAFQCMDRTTNARACSQKAPQGQGEFHRGTTCKNIGFGVSWGLVTAPAPPAKPSFQGASYRGQQMPAIPSPMDPSKRKLRF